MPLPFLNFFRPQRKITNCFGRTDCGRVRQNNEDSFALLAEQRIFMVADGMGGHNAGEVASRIAVELAVELCSPKNLSAQRGNPAAMQHFLIDVFGRINRRVIEAATEDDGRRGMGATLTFAYLEGRLLHCCHVGDSRCYLLRNGSLTRITTDHVADTSADTAYGEGQGVKSNAVTRIIGYPFPEDPEYHAVDIEPADKLLLCSDGLWSMLDDSEISRILLDGSDAEKACDALIKGANAAGGRDNITAVLVFIG